MQLELQAQQVARSASAGRGTVDRCIPRQQTSYSRTGEHQVLLVELALDPTAWMQGLPTHSSDGCNAQTICEVLCHV